MNKYTLLDGVKRNQENSGTFGIPCEHMKNNLQVGDFVKIVIEVTTPKEDELGGERPWVEITEINPPKITGKIANNLIIDVDFGDEISFELKNVIDVHKKDAPVNE